MPNTKKNLSSQAHAASQLNVQPTTQAKSTPVFDNPKNLSQADYIKYLTNELNIQNKLIERLKKSHTPLPKIGVRITDGEKTFRVGAMYLEADFYTVKMKELSKDCISYLCQQNQSQKPNPLPKVVMLLGEDKTSFEIKAEQFDNDTYVLHMENLSPKCVSYISQQAKTSSVHNNQTTNPPGKGFATSKEMSDWSVQLISAAEKNLLEIVNQEPIFLGVNLGRIIDKAKLYDLSNDNMYDSSFYDLFATLYNSLLKLKTN